jgi:UDP-N-acetylglucosamine 1-carboxyvinyltransferase
MEKFVIRGGRPLSGEVRISGAKNAALPVMAAALLTSEQCVVDNVPAIDDIRTMVELLAAFGCDVHLDEARHRVTICAANVGNCAIPTDLAIRMRASFLVTGPLLARFGHVEAPHPGGCAIGRRPVNVDIRGFQAMGGQVEQHGTHYVLRAEHLTARHLYLDYPSHTGTENLLMAACLARGRTVIKNASSEPEVVDLAEFLVRMGAHITGAGTPEIHVDGVDELYGVHHRVVSDRIEAGTFAIAGAITGGEVTLRDVVVAHMDPLTYKLREVGVDVVEGDRTYLVRGNWPLRGVEVQTLHYPGFPTDLQSAFATLLTQATGTSIIHERVYDNRLLYAEELRKLGASIRVSGQTATIDGPASLRGEVVRALDIRAGAALVLAGLAAEGTTEITDVYHVNRGYEHVEEKLRGLGASIERVISDGVPELVRQV